jgi:hypothetical protein
MAHELKNDLQDKLFIDGLTKILVDNKVLTEKVARDLRKSFDDQSTLTYEEFLLDEDFVSKENLLEALGEYYNLPPMDVMGVFFDHHLVKMFPKDVMLRNDFIPYDLDGDVLIVVAAKPNNPELPEIIGKFVSYDVTFMVGYFRDIADMAKEFYDESIEVADIELFEDNRDEHMINPLDDINNKIDED